MKRTGLRSPSLLLALAVAGIASVASANDGGSRALDPSEYRRTDAKPPALRRAPTRPSLPDDLRLEVAQPKATPPRPERGGQRPQGDRPGNAVHGRPEVVYPDARLDALEARARTAAHWAAERLVRERGLAQYYRVGFHSGLGLALNDPALGRYEYVDGHRQGRRSLRACAEGRTLGEQLADEHASVDATDAVEAQFTDLGREPRYLGAPVAPHLDVDPPDLPEPSLRAVMRDYPITVFHGLYGPRHGMFVGWGWDAQRLQDAHDHRDFYDAAWRDPARAFDWWARQRPAVVRRLGDAHERAVFAAEFQRAFLQDVARRHGRELERAYDAGLDDGWSYGAFVGEELHYRRGYHRGFRESYVEAVQWSFARGYGDAWTRAYAAEFDDWSQNAKPAIAGARLIDGNDDGVFEPGEALQVEYEVINYGGAAASVPVRLHGSSLLHEAHASLLLPARTVTTAVLDRAALRPAVRPRTRAGLTLVVAAERERLSVEVRRPLQFVPASLRIERDDLAGRLRVEIVVENISSRPIESDIAVHAKSPGFFESHGVPGLAAGERRRAGFVVEGLDPLDLLAGDVWLRFELDESGRGVVHDEQRYQLPEVATDLRNRDLLLYMTARAMGSPFSAGDVERARRLMLDRLRADWRQAVRSSGNPYRRDLKRHGAETALGELVVAWQADRARAARPEVYAGLSGDIVALTRDLPGAHPFLRKSMRKLASTLP